MFMRSMSQSLKEKSGKRKNKSLRFIGGLAVILLAAAALGAALVLSKTVRINPYFAEKYQVQGIDVSHYQGDICWEKIREQDIDFAFIKATEGSGHLDERFQENWEESAMAGIPAGAYHFFSFDSPGKNQAEWYITNAGSLEGRLIPAVDVEFYGNKEADPPQKAEVVRELKAFLDRLEDEYQARPVIYTTYKVYELYILGEFEGYPLWIRNVYYPPDVDMKGKWDFWQYTDRAVMDGYQGEEKYIDKNVFCGDEEEMKKGFCSAVSTYRLQGPFSVPNYKF